VGPSLLADIILLPALLTTARFVTLWDVLSVKLGDSPQETVRLFRGLRPSQARIAVLLGELRTVGAGGRVVTRGEPGSEMLVLIRGRAEVLGTMHGKRVRLGTVRRGDVIGEMGFVRGLPRTADVEATEETELLVVNERFFEVLERRYPRIAARVLLNLAQLMGDRLETTTERLVAAEAEV
jgi:CRP-like cAMP-binding protein